MIMKQEDKDLLLQDLCARLPYGLFVNINGIKCILQPHDISDFIKCDIDIKPYLFPLSSMTEEQKKEYKQFLEDIDGYVYSIDCVPQIDWLNKNKFDYRGLIEKGLAIDATGIYMRRKQNETVL